MVLRSLKAIIDHPEDLIPLVKLKIAASQVDKEIPGDPHWNFCYRMLSKVSRSFALVIKQLNSDLRNAVRYKDFFRTFVKYKTFSLLSNIEAISCQYIKLLVVKFRSYWLKIINVLITDPG